MLNLLADPIVRVIKRDGSSAALNLPEIYAGLADDNIAEFPALRAHQAPAWHALLVQLAVIACENADIDTHPGQDADGWAALIRRLTPEWPEDEPWRLVSPAETPAFLQSPSPGGDLADYRQDVAAPDALDLLVNSKNHDFKAERMTHAAPDDWLFALVSLQTQEGFLGRGNYGIARMNGGFASRPYLGLSPVSGGVGAAIMRDISVLLSADAEWDLRCDIIFAGAPRAGLVWLAPWTGAAALDLQGLPPLFIEICRRVRLRIAGDGLAARLANSAVARIDAKAQLGVLCDPWAPVEIVDPPKLLTLSADGFTYSRMVDLMFGSGKRRFERPRLAKPTQSERDRPMRMWAAALVRGQGKTEGFHTRSLVLPSKAMRAFADETSTLAERARTQVQMAGEMTQACLRPALIILVQKGPAEPAWTKPSNRDLIAPALRIFDQTVDTEFFPALWDGLDLDQETAGAAWIKILAKHARATLATADENSPCGAMRRIMAFARATEMLEGAMAKTFPQLRRQKEAEDDRDQRSPA